MSYILDALRRADAERERERGGAPGLHSTERLLTDVAEADDAPVVPPLPFARIVIGVLGTALAGAGTWWYLQRAQGEIAAATGAPAVQPIQPSAALAPPMVAALPAGADAGASVAAAGVPPGLAPPSQGAAALPAALPGATPAPVDAMGRPPGPPPLMAGTLPGPAAAASGPPLMPQPRILPDVPGVRPMPPDPRAPVIQPQLPGQGPTAAPRGPVTAAPASLPPPAAMAVPTSPTPAPSPAAVKATQGSPAAGPAPEALPRLRDLPESTRKELPALAVSGSMYSPQPTSRMVVLDGQVLREGQAVVPGLTIEQIGPRSAILAYKGQRFELPF